MTSDLVERLRGLHVTRHPSRCVVECDETTILEAAAEIERLRAALRGVRADTLEEAAKVAETYERLVRIEEPIAKYLVMPDGRKVQLQGSKLVDRTGCDDIAAAIRAIGKKP